MTELAPSPSMFRPHWWSVLLVASLGINLAVGGVVAARFLWPERAERFTGGTYTQLLPRKFLRDLSEDRRKELVEALRGYRTRYRDSRRQMNDAAEKLAQALKSDPYDQSSVASAIRDFEGAGTGMMANGSAAALDLIAKLDARERVTLAERIAERVRRPRR